MNVLIQVKHHVQLIQCYTKHDVNASSWQELIGFQGGKDCQTKAS